MTDRRISTVAVILSTILMAMTTPWVHASGQHVRVVQARVLSVEPIVERVTVREPIQQCRDVEVVYQIGRASCRERV